MKITLRQLVDSLDFPDGRGGMVEGSFSRFRRSSMAIKAAFRCRQISEQVIQYVNQFNDLKNELLKRHGTLSEDGSRSSIETPEQAIAFQTDFQDLLNVEIEIVGERFELSDFQSTAAMQEADLANLDWLIDAGATPDPVKPIAWTPKVVATDTASDEDILDLIPKTDAATA